MHDQVIYLLTVLTERNTYALKDGFLYCSKEKVKVGQRVKIVFNKVELTGFVIKVETSDKDIAEISDEYGFDILEIKEIIDEKPIIKEDLIELVKRISDRYFYPLVGALQTMLPPELKPRSLSNVTKIQYEKYYVLHKDKIPEKKTPAMEKILAKLNYFSQIPTSMIGKSKSLNTLLECGAITIKQVEKYRYKIEKIYDYENEITLTEDQEKAFKGIFESDKTISLLFGVTGSGKTEVYIKAIEKVINEGKRALVLVPEIALTPLMISRIVSYFDENMIAIMHSSLTNAQKYDEYRKIADNKIKIVIGTRSAIFVPLNDIGLIIIDEEDSSTYKEENPNLIPYVVKDVAAYRANYYGAKVILGSATPLVETMAKVKNGDYNMFRLEKRYHEAELPQVEIVDKKDFNNFTYQSTIFSIRLIQEIKDRIAKNESVILLINNRGYGRNLYCRECGHSFKCTRCGNTLVYHKEDNTLRCHHCDFKMKKPDKCPKCGSKYLAFSGYGIERVEEEFKKIFNVPYLVLDSDRTPKSLQISTILSKFEKKEALVLIGTQIVSKGHDFDDVTLVGILNADYLLNYPSYRARESTFSLILQTIGRAGRKDKKGLAIVQTSYQDDYAISCAINNDYEGFYEYEIAERKSTFNPPFYNILCIQLRSKKLADLKIFGAEVHSFYKKVSENTIVCPFSIIREFKDYCVGRVYIKYKSLADIKEQTLALLLAFSKNQKIKIDVIPNPLDF